MFIFTVCWCAVHTGVLITLSSSNIHNLYTHTHNKKTHLPLFMTKSNCMPCSAVAVIFPEMNEAKLRVFEGLSAQGDCGNRISILCSWAMALSLRALSPFMLRQRPLHTHTHTHTHMHARRHTFTPCHLYPFPFSQQISMDTVHCLALAVFQRQCNTGQLPVDAIKNAINQKYRKNDSVYLPINRPLCPVASCTGSTALGKWCFFLSVVNAFAV